MKKIILIIIGLMMVAFASGGSFSRSSSKTTVNIGEQFTVTYSASDTASEYFIGWHEEIGGGCSPSVYENFISKQAADSATQTKTVTFTAPATTGTCTLSPTSNSYYEFTGASKVYMEPLSITVQSPSCASDSDCSSDTSCKDWSCSGGSCIWGEKNNGGGCSLGVLTGICDNGDCVEEECTPSCTGKTCGDNGCGGSCGTCSGSQSCISGVCTTVQGCTPSCSGKTCGTDGCGGSCGTCVSGTTCVSGSCQGDDTTTTTTNGCQWFEDKKDDGKCGFATWIIVVGIIAIVLIFMFKKG